MAEPYALDAITDERTARIALNYAVPAGHDLTGRLLHRYGGLQTIQFARGDEPPGDNPTTMRIWRAYFENYDPDLVTRGVDLAEQHGLATLIPGDQDWPTGIDDLRESAPIALWARGTRPDLLNKQLWERASIAGSRAASFDGRWNSQQLSVWLALRGIPTVAASSHGVPRLALAGTLGSTTGGIAVFGSGLDDPYPATPNGFFNSIADNGILLSETPPGVRPSRDSLQGMSRIVAALSGVTTIIESGARGHAMDTALHAKRLHRHVAAVRGPENDMGSIGTDILLDRLAALPVIDHHDITSALDNFRRKREMTDSINEPLREAQSATPDELKRPQSARPQEHGPSRSL